MSATKRMIVFLSSLDEINYRPCPTGVGLNSEFGNRGRFHQKPSIPN
jgi:hypothetical protein